MSNYRIGFDVGGTKIQIIVLDGERVMFTREMTTSEDVARNYELINFMYQNAVEDINYCSHTRRIIS
jgi:predicted NBD/HSP70 family sugar kinase